MMLPQTTLCTTHRENFDTKVNAFPAKNERKKKRFASYLISVSFKVIEKLFSPKDSTFMKEFRNRK